MSDVEAKVIADLLRGSLQRGQHPTLTIRSNSMRPLLQMGDQIWLETAVPARLQPGDVITLWEGHDLLTHRYWGAVTQNGTRHLVTRGDRPLHLDPLQPASHLIGRVMARQRGGRYIDIQTGLGRRLNRYLAQLVQWEWRYLLRQPPATTLDGAPGWPPKSGNRRQSGGRRWRRRILFGASWTLVATLSLWKQ